MRRPLTILITCLCFAGPAAGADPDLRPIPFAEALVGDGPPAAATVVAGTASDDPLVRALAWGHAAGVEELADEAVIAVIDDGDEHPLVRCAAIRCAARRVRQAAGGDRGEALLAPLVALMIDGFARLVDPPGETLFDDRLALSRLAAEEVDAITADNPALAAIAARELDPALAVQLDRIAEIYRSVPPPPPVEEKPDGLLFPDEDAEAARKRRRREGLHARLHVGRLHRELDPLLVDAAGVLLRGSEGRLCVASVLAMLPPVEDETVPTFRRHSTSPALLAVRLAVHLPDPGGELTPRLAAMATREGGEDWEERVDLLVRGLGSNGAHAGEFLFDLLAAEGGRGGRAVHAFTPRRYDGRPELLARESRLLLEMASQEKSEHSVRRATECLNRLAPILADETWDRALPLFERRYRRRPPAVARHPGDAAVLLAAAREAVGRNPSSWIYFGDLFDRDPRREPLAAAIVSLVGRSVAGPRGLTGNWGVYPSCRGNRSSPTSSITSPSTRLREKTVGCSRAGPSRCSWIRNAIPGPNSSPESPITTSS